MENKSKHCLYKTFYKEYSINFLTVCKLIGFTLVAPKLLIFEVCGIIRISKMEFFSFSGSERLKQNQKIKNIQKLLILHVNHFLNNLRKFRIYFSFFTETLTIALPVNCWGWEGEGGGSDNTELHLKHNISKMVRVNIALVERFLKNI